MHAFIVYTIATSTLEDLDQLLGMKLPMDMITMVCIVYRTENVVQLIITVRGLGTRLVIYSTDINSILCNRN